MGRYLSSASAVALTIAANSVPLLPGQLPTFGTGNFMPYYGPADGTTSARTFSFVVPAGVYKIRGRVIGGGGRCGANYNPSQTNAAGGSVSIGTLLSATGGAVGTIPGSLVGGAGAAGGVGSGGDFQANGGSGGNGGNATDDGASGTKYGMGGGGGAAGSEFGRGGNGGIAPNATLTTPGSGGGIGGLDAIGGARTKSIFGSDGVDLFGLSPSSVGAGGAGTGPLNGGHNPAGLPMPWPGFAYQGGVGAPFGIPGPGVGGSGVYGAGGICAGGSGGFTGNSGPGGLVTPALLLPEQLRTYNSGGIGQIDYGYGIASNGFSMSAGSWPLGRQIGGGDGGRAYNDAGYPGAGGGQGGFGGGGYARGVFNVVPGQTITVSVGLNGFAVIEW